MKKITVIILMMITTILVADVRLITMSESQIIYNISINVETEDGGDFTEISADGWLNTDEPGAPQLPVKILNILIPDNGSLQMSISNIETRELMLEKPIIPAPTVEVSDLTHAFKFIMNDDFYKRGAELVEVGEVQRYRFYEFVPLTINPIQLDSHGDKMVVTTSFDLTINIDGDTSRNIVVNDTFKSIEKKMFANYSIGKHWQSRPDFNLDVIPFDASDYWYKISINQDGLFVLSNDMLSQIPDYLNPESAVLYSYDVISSGEENDIRLKQIPLQWDSVEKGKISADDKVYFRYDDYIVFDEIKTLWLSFGFEPADGRPGSFDEQEALIPTSFEVVEAPGFDKLRDSAQVVIIYPEEFENEAEELSQFYLEDFGYYSILKDQQDIFTEYSGGSEIPQALKSYLQALWSSAHGEALEYVILLGSGTNNWAGNTDKNRIITYSTSDANFVSFSSVYPDLIIGRYPAQNKSDLQFLIERTKTYVREPLSGWWRNKLLIMADDENKDAGLEGTTTNSGLNHTNLAQETEDLLSEGIWVDKVLGLEYDFDEFNSKPDARDAMVASVNEGRLIWYYIGHGNPDVLGDEEYFRGSQHLRLLDNIEHLPLFIAASCSVGEFDSSDFDCIAERILFLDNGGSVASLAAARTCSGTANTSIMKEFLTTCINNYENIGYSLMAAKVLNPYTSTGKLYNLLGDPIISVVPPRRTGHIYNIPDSLRARQTLAINADFEVDDIISNLGTVDVFDTKSDVHYSHTIGEQTYEVDYSVNGNSFFKGDVEIDSNIYESTFIVPDDVHNGSNGRIITYVWDDLGGVDYVNYYAGIKLSKNPIEVESLSPPDVNIWMESRKFQSGDYVSTNPEMIVEVSDENGVNILGSAGHKILVIVDDSLEPIDVTSSFVYYSGSHTTGELRWRLSDLEEGSHTLQLVVFDNLNNPTVAEVDFISRKTGDVAIEDLLPYPNPMKDDGFFTFVLTESADVTISIFTITGRKIRTIKQVSCEAGYNQIYWDGKDGDGDNIANNTYFYKVKAKGIETGKGSEKVGKVIILK